MPPARLSAALGLIVLSGCLAVPSQDEAQVEWGLGLDLSAPTPPAPFREDPHELDHLFAFANASAERMEARCPGELDSRAVHTAAAERSMRAFFALLDACDAADRARVGALIADARRNGTLEESFQSTRDEAWTAKARALDALRAAPVPGTIVDAEYQAFLANQYDASRQSLHLGDRELAAFRRLGDEALPGTITSGFVHFMGARRSFEAIEALARGYPWQPGHCEPPQLEAEAARARARLADGLALAEPLVDEEDRGFVSNPYGYMVNWIAPRIENLTEEGLVWGLVRWRADLDFHHAYWENATRTTLPTLEEARFLVNLHRSTLRSLSTDLLWESEMAIVEHSAAYWTEDASRAIGPLALQAVTWQFEDIMCVPGTENPAN